MYSIVVIRFAKHIERNKGQGVLSMNKSAQRTED